MKLAWHIAALSRLKILPDLKTLMSRRRQAPQKPQSGDEAFAIVSMYQAAFGGPPLKPKG